MTDKEWYAKLSTIVLEGIELANKDANRWDIYRNQNDLRDFVYRGALPDQRKKEAIRSAMRSIANIAMWGGFVIAGVFLFFDLILWMDVLLKDPEGILHAIAFLIASIMMCGVGVIGQYFDELL